MWLFFKLLCPLMIGVGNRVVFENRGAFAFTSEVLFVLTAAFNPLIQSDEHTVA